MPEMKTYNCVVSITDIDKVALSQVLKTNVTAAEVELLRVVHGQDNVTGIVEVGSVKRTNTAERTRLGLRYRDERVNEAFGKSARLPDEVEVLDSLDLIDDEAGDVE